MVSTTDYIIFQNQTAMNITDVQVKASQETDMVWMKCDNLKKKPTPPYFIHKALIICVLLKIWQIQLYPNKYNFDNFSI